MILRSRFALLVVMAIISASCASSSNSSGGGKKPDLIIDPKIKPAGPLRFTADRRFREFSIEVSVDETGRADVAGMRVIGDLPQITRDDIAAWLSASTFEPARQGGVPVRGVFKMQMRAR